MVAAQASLPLKRSTFSAAAGPEIAIVTPIVNPTSNELGPRIITPPV